MSENWDLVVIGTGGAAMAAGIEARSRGKSVLLIEHSVIGGTCLNIGCVPSKNLLAAAGPRHRAPRATPRSRWCRRPRAPSTCPR
jgi:mercuric reductase